MGCEPPMMLAVPPRAVTATDVGGWVAPPGPAGATGWVRCAFVSPGRPRQAWLRVTTAAAYTLTINGKEHHTGDLRGLNLTPDAKLGPFPVKWGKSGTLVLRVSSALYLRTAWARVEEDDALFILNKANGALTLKDENGKEVRVVLRCPEAVPPDTSVPG